MNFSEKKNNFKNTRSRVMRSSSEPLMRQLQVLPSIALSDISKRHQRTIEQRDRQQRLWDSSTTIQHDHVTSLSAMSLSRTSSKRGKLTKITEPSFKLSGAELNNLPRTVFNMVSIEKLVLSPNEESCLKAKLQSLPREIGNMQNLRQLVLDTNELKELPKQLSDLRHLDTLTLSNNHLAMLPEGFSKLSNLRSLHLANNRFTELPVEVCLLENITFLDMSDNSIREIPEEIYLLADKLTLLSLYINDLQELPDCVCDLYELTTLWLGKNQLKRLPERFGDMENLDWADCPSETNIDDNPLISPPLEVCRKGITAIKEFFFSNIKS